jgi:hypothetical protein
MVPEFGCHIQLGISEVHSAKIRSDLPAVSLEGMTSHTPFTHEEATSFCRVLRKKLSPKRGCYEKNDRSKENNRFPHYELLKPTVRITKLTMQNEEWEEVSLLH